MRSEDLIKPLTKMNPDELRDFIRNLRNARAVYVENSKKPAHTRTKKTKNKVIDLLEGMSDEDKLKLLEQLGE